jgi:hypothetical protein
MRPCFVNLMKQQGVKLPPKKMTFGDKTFIVGDEVDPCGATQFSCPLCRAVVERVFQAEEVNAANLIPAAIIDNIVDVFYQKYGQ